MNRRKLLKIIGLSAVGVQVPFLPKGPTSEFKMSKTPYLFFDEFNVGAPILTVPAPFEEELDQDFLDRFTEALAIDLQIPVALLKGEYKKEQLSKGKRPPNSGDLLLMEWRALNV